MFVLLAIHVAVAFGMSNPPLPADHSWPPIKEVSAGYLLTDHGNESLILPIQDAQGKPVYLLECFLNAYEHATNDFDYSGDLECRLTSDRSDSGYSTLLTEEEAQSRDWQSRGRFLLEEITGTCAVYPEFGRLRHFNFRGMTLTLQIDKLELGEADPIRGRARIKLMQLSFSAINNPNAKGWIAAPVPYVYPPYLHPENDKDSSLDCSRILMRK